MYHYGGGRAVEGNNLIIDEIHEPTGVGAAPHGADGVRRHVVTHLFGGSAGREGTAIQMSGSLTDGASRLLRLGPDDRRTMLVAAMAGGFGAVFGVPLAGAVFGLEVQAVGRLRYEALVPSLVASVVGDLVVRRTRDRAHDHAGPGPRSSWPPCCSARSPWPESRSG